MTLERQVSAALSAKVADLQQKLTGASKGMGICKAVLSATEQQQQELPPREPWRYRRVGAPAPGPKAQLVGSIYRSNSTASPVIKKGDMKSTAVPAKTRYSASN